MNRLQRWGIDVAVHPGWDARLVCRKPEAHGVSTHPLLHVANFRMPSTVVGDYGSHVVAQMRSSHLLVVVKEFDPLMADSALYHHPVPWPLRADDFDPQNLQRTIVGQSGLQRFFSCHGRAFSLYVVLGSHARRALLVAEANRALAGVTLERVR